MSRESAIAFEIREFAPEDYPPSVEIHSAIHPSIDSFTIDGYQAREVE